MKKKYQNPETKVIKVQTSQIIAASPVEMYGKNATSEAMSRDGGSSWDDEDDY